MRVLACKQIVQAFFSEAGGYEEHTESRVLRRQERSYVIRPDDAYFFPDRVICIEYEAMKRPVESIGKYWWLLKKTGWLEEAVELYCFLFVLNRKTGRIPEESCLVLGNELSRMHPDSFFFNCLLPEEASEKRVRSLLDHAF